MHVNWCGAAIKGRIRQIYLRQDENQCNKKQQGHKDEQTQRLDRPSFHGGEA